MQSVEDDARAFELAVRNRGNACLLHPPGFQHSLMMAFFRLGSIVIYHLIRDEFLNHVQKSSH